MFLGFFLMFLDFNQILDIRTWAPMCNKPFYAQDLEKTILFYFKASFLLPERIINIEYY